MDEKKDKSILERFQENYDRCYKSFKEDKAKGFTQLIQYGQIKSLLKEIFGSNSVIVNKLFDVPSKLLSNGESGKRFIEQAEFLKKLIDSLNAMQSGSLNLNTIGIGRIFVGHGKNPVWSRVVSYLKDELKYDVTAYESESHTSEHILDILKQFLDECNVAVIVMTVDDATIEGKQRARQNVIHEIGLFQGRYGFNKVILIRQSGLEDFSNISGQQVIQYNEKSEDTFYELERALKKIKDGKIV